MAVLPRLAILLALCSSCFGQHMRRKYADIPIKTTDGKTFRISQYRGKVVMIVMVASADDNCLRTMQFMSRSSSPT
jgi:hypothetical protein